MRERIQGFRLACAALFLTLCCVVGFSAEANASEAQVVRVAFPLQAGLCEVDAEGNYSGYTYEYLEEIAQYTGWDLEFVQAGDDVDESFPVLMDMLKRGEVDLMGGLVYSEQMAELVDYASQSYGTAYTTLEVLSDNTAITKDNYQTMQNMRIGALTTAKVRVAELDQFCKTNGILYSLVRMDTEQEIMQALNSGEVDAFLSTDLSLKPSTRTIAKFSPRPFYFVTTKGNAKTLQMLNKSILSISEVDPVFSANLMERYFGDVESNAIFSDEDQRYIQNAGTIRAAVVLGEAPFQYHDNQTGEIKGIAIDLLSYISDSTGLTFELVPVETQEELQRLIEAHEVDIVASVTYDYRQAGERSLSLTRPFTSSQNMMLSNSLALEGGLNQLRIAVPKMMYDQSALSNHTGEVVWYDTLKQCVAAVREGEADYTCGNGYSIQFFMNQTENRKLHMSTLSQEVHRMSLGVVRPGSKALLTVLNKAIINLPDEQLQTMIYENISNQGEMTLQEYIVANPSGALMTLACVSLIVILSLLAVLLTRIRVSRQTALDLKKHYQLYALSDDHFFEYDFRKDQLMLSIRDGKKDEKDSSVFVYEKAQSADEKDWKRTEFVRYVKGRKDGTEEICSSFFNEEPRWLRVTTRTVHDGGVPAYVIGKFTDVDEEHREKDELVEQAQKDGLTQVFNAAEIRTRIVEHLADLPDGRRDAMVIVDIDYFKGINDEFGHFVGDQILQQVADAMRAACSGKDLAGRLGGDEFALYFVDTEAMVLQARCQRLLENIRRLRLPENGQSVTVSIGAALTTEGIEYDELYQRADGALYEAKNQGRSRVAVAEDI